MKQRLILFLDSMEDCFPEPEVLATEIAENLEAALEQFRSIVENLQAE